MSEHRSVFAIYCDDIRQEVGNKLSFMGCYNGHLILSQLPIVLPQLCVQVTVITPMTRPFQKLTIKLYKDDQVLATHIFPDTDLVGQANLINSSMPIEQQAIFFKSNFVLSPFAIDTPGVLRVRAENEGEELKGPGLIIEGAPVN